MVGGCCDCRCLHDRRSRGRHRRHRDWAELRDNFVPIACGAIWLSACRATVAILGHKLVKTRCVV